jgi:AcrR family transcriptional regulator
MRASAEIEMRIANPKPELSQRKKAQAMRRAQACAIGLFEERGFASVSMTEIAEQSEVSVASLFRYFGTKEQVVLWDEHDDRVIPAVAAQLERGLSGLAAVAAGVAAALSGGFGAKASLERRKMSLIFREPALLAAFRANTRLWADAFGPMFARTEGASGTTLANRAAAAAAAVLVEVCLEEWFGREDRQDLATLIGEAFAAVGPQTTNGHATSPFRSAPAWPS